VGLAHITNIMAVTENDFEKANPTASTPHWRP